MTNTKFIAPEAKPRFFTLPKTDEVMAGLLAKKKHSEEKKQVEKKGHQMRYAAYVRISSDDQVGNYSVDAQLRAIKTWVQGQGGLLVKTYVDEAVSGKTSDRPGFQQMRLDARGKKFDALIVHKFDRFARNRTDALALKSLLRYDYGIKVFSVTEPSEDSDGPIGALIEGIMESVAEWYSRNLATEISKGIKERNRQGKHTNNAPFGYRKNDESVLVHEETEVPGVILAFEAYATGKHSYASIANLLNEAGYRSKTGRLFSKFTVREILRNRIYLGEVSYQETRYNSDGSRNFTAPVEWNEGQHKAIISEELWEKCREAQSKRGVHRQTRKRYNPYLLRGLVYCHRCCTNPVPEADFRAWGKMNCKRRTKTGLTYYWCPTRSNGFDCDQKSVRTDTIDAQVIQTLVQLNPPEDWKEQVSGAVSRALGEQTLEQRLQQIRETINRMDFRWDQGFITDKADYLEKRLGLQQELEQLTPAYDELGAAVDLLADFPTHWGDCKGDEELQHELIKLIVERVYVQDGQLVAMTLKSDYHLVLGHNAEEPTYMEVDPMVHVWARRDSNP